MNKNKYLYVGLLVFVLLVSLWIRLIPMDLMDTCVEGVDCFRALDPFYMYRISLHLIENEFHLPDNDLMQYYPNGRDPHENLALTYYIPAILYSVFFKFFFTYYKFAWIYPALMGTLQVLAIYLLASQLRNKKTGLFAAFLYATTPAILYRTSAGFIEKEPLAGIFIIMTMYYIVKSFKKDTIFNSMLGGMCFCFLNVISGLANPIMLLIIGFYFILLLFKKKNISLLLKSQIPIAVMGVILPFLLGFKRISVSPLYANGQLLLGLSALICFVYFAQKKVKDKSMHKYIIPVSITGVIFMVFIGSFFIPSCAGLIKSVTGLVALEKGVSTTTVAENAPGSLAQIENQFSVASGISYMQQVLNTPLFNQDKSYNIPGTILSYFSVTSLLWIFLIFIFYELYKKRGEYKNKDIFYLALIAVPLLGYFNFYYGLIAFVFFISFYSTNIGIILIVLWMASSIHGSLKYIRVMFLLGAPFCIMAGMGASYLYEGSRSLIKNQKTIDFFEKIKERSSSKKEDVQNEEDETINIIPFAKAIAVIFIAVCFISVNISSAYVVNKYTGLTFDSKWQESMKWMKHNTPEDAAIMSWWDYGYWFQTAGNRRSTADGMNANNTVNEHLAQMFTDTNITHIKDLMIEYQADYMVVDRTLIGKYPMMSRIGHYAGQNDYYEEDNLFKKPENYFSPLPQPQLEKKNNITVAIFNFGGGIISVPLNENGGLMGNIMLTQGMQNMKIKYLCTQDGLVDLAPNETSNVADFCMLFSKYGTYIPYPTKTPGISNFARLYIFDGHNIPFLEKVFDNEEIKIFKLIKENNIDNNTESEKTSILDESEETSLYSY